MTCPKDKQQAFFLLTIIFRKAQQATQVPNLTNLLPIKTHKNKYYNSSFASSELSGRQHYA